MSKTTREINKITTTVISISVKLIVYALVILLLYEAVTRGFAFGHEIFYAEAAEEEPGRDVRVTISAEDSLQDTAAILAEHGLITNEFAFVFQGMFYDYSDIYPGTYTFNTSMTSKEILQVLNEAPEEELIQETQQSAETAAEEDAKPAEASAEAGEAGVSEEAQAEEAGAGVNARAAAADGAQEEHAQTSAEAAAAGETEVSAGQEAAAFSLDNGDESVNANDRYYAGEEIEQEGGWIEDVAGEEAP